MNGKYEKKIENSEKLLVVQTTDQPLFRKEVYSNKGVTPLGVNS